MSMVIKPYTIDVANNRPGVELFVWRVAVLSAFFALSLFLFPLQLHGMSVIKKAVTLSCSLVLLLMIVYHLYLILLLKKLSYHITSDSVTIRSFLLHEKIEFSEIKELTRPANETLVLKKKKMFSYFKEAPQIVFPVAQLGTCTLEGLGTVTFYSFVDNFKEPKNLLLIRTRKNRQYAISPVPIDEFVNLINRARS
jgi:hypothetical protein